MDLGELLPPPSTSVSQLVRRRRSPGYYRRQEKRKEARKAEAACNEKIVREAPAASTVDTVEKQSMEGNATIAEETVKRTTSCTCFLYISDKKVNFHFDFSDKIHIKRNFFEKKEQNGKVR